MCREVIKSRNYSGKFTGEILQLKRSRIHLSLREWFGVDTPLNHLLIPFCPYYPKNVGWYHSPYFPNGFINFPRAPKLNCFLQILHDPSKSQNRIKHISNVICNCTLEQQVTCWLYLLLAHLIAIWKFLLMRLSWVKHAACSASLLYQIILVDSFVFQISFQGQ